MVACRRRNWPSTPTFSRHMRASVPWVVGSELQSPTAAVSGCQWNTYLRGLLRESICTQRLRACERSAILNMCRSAPLSNTPGIAAPLRMGEVTRPVSGGGPLIRTYLRDRVGRLQLAVGALQLASTLQHRGVSDSDDNRAGGDAEAIQ